MILLKKSKNLLGYCSNRFLPLILATFLISMQAISQKTISGVISDADAVPLPGVNVIVKGTNKGVVTDFDGNFALEANDGDVLTISFIGFTTQEVVVGAENNLSISLDEDYAKLDEVIITGYGSTAKKDLVSSISQIKGEALTNLPSARVDNLLQGRATGVQVTATSGDPSAAPQIRIRGVSSISGNNRPLFVIDGFIVGNDYNLNNLNVNDIKSMEILKDASSLAIYGTRGAAGVILIETKNGKSSSEGSVDVSINHYSSFEQLARNPDMAGIDTWYDYWSEGMSFLPSGTGSNDPDYVFPYDANYPGTDWTELISRNGRIDNTDLSISGNSSKANYFVSYNRFSQEAIIKGSGMVRNTLRANLDIQLKDNLRTGLRLSLSDRKQDLDKVSWGTTNQRLIPYRKIYNDDGTYTASNPVSGSLERNPVADVNERILHNFVTNIIASSYIEYDPIPQITLRSSLGSTLNFVKMNEYQPNNEPLRYVQNQGGLGSVDMDRASSVLFENTITYSEEFGDHSIKILAGYTSQKDLSAGNDATAQGFPNDALTFNNLGVGSDTETFVVGSHYRQRTFESILGRINYGFKDKYLLTLVGRRDGSSVFETGRKYAFFPSMGAAWKISEEDFMQGQDLISNLKLRASYGIVGEQGVNSYNSIARFRNYNVFLNNTMRPAVFIADLPSSNLDWEKTYQTDIGVEVGFLNNRYTLEIDYYNKQTKDLLLEKPLPGTAGTVRLENVGEVENKGIEIAISSVNIEKPDFSWSSTLTLSANRNKVLSLGGGARFLELNDPVHPGAGEIVRLIEGEPMPSYVGVKYLGTYKSDAEIAEDPAWGNQFIGGPRFEDYNGDGVLNQLDFHPLGNSQPDFFGGLRNVISYKNFTLDVFIHGSVGNEVYNGAVHESWFGRGPEVNILPELKDRWTVSNPNSDIPRAGTSQGIFRLSTDRSVQDASFIRIKNVSLTYDFNPPVFDSASIYVTANNLLLITPFDFGDPERSSFGSGGGSGALEQGVADGAYPYSSSFAVGLRLNL